MNSWICLKCGRIVIAKEFLCCGEIEQFNPERHCRLIIGKSNAWIRVWGMWQKHPLLKQISQDLANDGCYSAATILNQFIEHLIEKEK